MIVWLLGSENMHKWNVKTRHFIPSLKFLPDKGLHSWLSIQAGIVSMYPVFYMGGPGGVHTRSYFVVCISLDHVWACYCVDLQKYNIKYICVTVFGINLLLLLLYSKVEWNCIIQLNPSIMTTLNKDQPLNKGYIKLMQACWF